MPADMFNPSVRNIIRQLQPDVPRSFALQRCLPSTATGLRLKKLRPDRVLSKSADCFTWTLGRSALARYDVGGGTGLFSLVFLGCLMSQSCSTALFNTLVRLAISWSFSGMQVSANVLALVQILTASSWRLMCQNQTPRLWQAIARTESLSSAMEETAAGIATFKNYSCRKIMASIACLIESSCRSSSLSTAQRLRCVSARVRQSLPRSSVDRACARNPQALRSLPVLRQQHPRLFSVTARSCDEMAWFSAFLSSSRDNSSRQLRCRRAIAATFSSQQRRSPARSVSGWEWPRALSLMDCTSSRSQMASRNLPFLCSNSLRAVSSLALSLSEWSIIMKLIKWLGGFFWSKEEKKEEIQVPDEISWEYILSDSFPVIHAEKQPFSLQELEAMIADGTWRFVSRDKLEITLLRELPFHLRRRVWLQIAQVDQLKQKSHKNYSQLCTTGPQLDKIAKDVHRTLSNFSFFEKIENQRKLQRVLMAYSNSDPEVGYVQGLNFLAGGLLMLLDVQMNLEDDILVIDNQTEENVYWLLCYILQVKGLRKNYLAGMAGLFECTAELRGRLRLELPRLYNRFQAIGLDYCICFCREYLTLVLVNFDWNLSAKILDLYLLGSLAVVHGMVIKALQVSQDKLLTLDIEQVLMFVKNNLWEELACWTISNDFEEKDRKKLH